MKKCLILFLVLATMTHGCAALAEDWASVAEIYDQVQAMGGTWQAKFDTPDGEVNIDVPVLVPNVETMPVRTLGQIKPITEERFNELEAQGRAGDKDMLQYNIEVDGEPQEVFYGSEYTTRLGEVHEGYDVVETTWVQHGAYRFSEGIGSLDRARPKTYHYGPWELDTGEAYLRGRTLTVEDAMDLMRKDIAAHFPGETFDIQPAKMVFHGSTLSEENGKAKEYKRDGYYSLDAEQLIDGVPLMGGILLVGASDYSQRHGATQESNRELDRLSDLYAVGTNAVFGHGVSGYFATETDYRTMLNLARKRTVEIEDVPLASLDSVLDALGKMVEQGDIGELYSVKLGYILYADPEMKDYAAAIPRWVAEYKTPKDMARRMDPEDGPWVYNQKILIDAQSAEPILFTIGDESIYAVPEMKTWEDVK